VVLLEFFLGGGGGVFLAKDFLLKNLTKNSLSNRFA